MKVMRTIPAPPGWARAATVLALAALLAGCQSPLRRIDQRVDALMTDRSAALGPAVPAPSIERLHTDPTSVGAAGDPLAETPATTNPDAADLPFTPADEAQDVIERLEAYNQTPGEALSLDLAGAIAYAIRHGRDYRFAEEEYVLDALRLLIERHQWGPRFFDDVTATVEGSGDGGLFDTSLRLVNEFRVTQRLPYGGEVSARALARATEDLHLRVSGENTQSADIILDADLPLLRGAGWVARENLIQAERDLIYAARDFERFRRSFIFDITAAFLNLTVRLQGIGNTEDQVRSLEELAQRERSLFDAGRITRYESALSEQRTVVARDTLNSLRENYRLAVDRFKVRIGMPSDQPLRIVPSSPGLPTPQIGLDEAVQAALTWRLDLQTARDQLDDSRRAVEIARNDLLPDLDVFASGTIPTESGRDRAGLRFDPRDADFQAGVTFGLPLDREIERLNLRQRQIALERAKRSYEEFRDSVAVDARAAVRDIDRALFSLQIQERSIQIAQERLASIRAAPERADARDSSDAVDDLSRAQNDVDAARRDLQLAILRYLLDTGQLRIEADGSIRPLAGMALEDTGAEEAEGTPQQEMEARP